MIVAIICIILSIIVMTSTCIYLKKDKNIKEIIIKKKQRKNLKNLWEIDDIRDGIIISGVKNTIVMKIGSIDYHLLSEKEQNALEINLIEIAKTIKYPLQFFSTTEFIDTTEIIKDIEKKSINSKENIKLKIYASEIIEHLKKIMENRNLYVRKNYILISSNGGFEKSKNDLMAIYENLRFNLLNTKINLEILDDFEIINLLHREFNKNTTIKIDNIFKNGGLELYAKRSEKYRKKKEEK